VIYSIIKSPQTYKELNMSYLYTVMQTDVSQFLGSGASYANDKLLLKGLTSNEANAYLGEVYRVDELGFNPDDDEELEGLSIGELTQIADEVQISKAQASYLYETRFKPDYNGGV